MTPNNNITVRIRRKFTTAKGDHTSKMKFHEQRASLMHQLVEDLSLEVSDWGKTDIPNPKETVTVVLTTPYPGVYTTMVETYKAWIETGQVEDVTFEFPNEGRLVMREGTVEEAEELAKENGLFEELKTKNVKE